MGPGRLAALVDALFGSEQRHVYCVTIKEYAHNIPRIGPYMDTIKLLICSAIVSVYVHSSAVF